MDAENAKAIAKKILFIEIDHSIGVRSDNLAIMLASFFQKSLHHPEDRTFDETNSWTQWAVDQVDLVEEKIVEILKNHA
jgi:hypothetical protein